MRSIENISEIEMDNKEYQVIDHISYNSKDYLILMNKKDNEDVMCLRALLNDTLNLEKLDNEEELVKVLEIFYEKNK